MRPVEDFELLRPATVQDAATLLVHDGARLVAGGTDLLPNLRRGLLEPSCLIDLSGVAGFDAIEREQGQWRIGAGATLTAMQRHQALAADLPALTDAAGQVAGPGHRSAATLGGNLCQDTRCVYYNQSEWWRAANDGCLKLQGDICHVAPQGQRCHAAFHGDLAPVLLAYGAELEVVGPERTDRRPLAALYRDDGAAHLALEPHEVLAAVYVPVPGSGCVSAYRKARVRGAMDFPLAGVAVALRVDAGVLAELSIGLSGIAPRPLRLDGTEALLGRPADDALLRALSKLVQKQISPMRSTVTSSYYRRLVTIALIERLVRTLAGVAPE